MHDTAYRIGGLVMDAYLPASPAKILEIGALNVNGSLRDHSPRNAEYIGLDFEAGAGVDVVITGLDDWNVPNSHYDLVMASSVFEHDPFFWKTFLAMCRKTKSGGHVYISAPSNGTVHRYPRDYWRFYPDSGIALEECARAEGFDVTLIESFVAERETDGWNDFCAVFRVGPCENDLNLDFVHTKVRVTNAINWRSSLIVDPTDDPEDVRLLRRSREEGHVLRLEGEALRDELNIQRATHAGEVAALESRVAALNRQVEELTDQKAGAEQRLHERFREIAGLTRLIQERDQEMEGEHARAEWLRQVVSVLTRGFSSSRKAHLGSMQLVWFRQRRQQMLLRQQGLFDPEDYMAVNPDVAHSGGNPLRHYINHGIVEGRPVGRGG